MESSNVYVVKKHKAKSRRRILAVAQKLDNLANNLGELLRRDQGEHGDYNKVLSEYDAFYRKTVSDIISKDIYAERYFKVNMDFFMQNYGTLQS